MKGSLESKDVRIARNAVALYARMFVSLLIRFFASRVVLQALGVSDYGVYSVVGNLILMVTVFNTSLTGATSRFLTYQLGAGDPNRLRRTFSTAFWAHVGLAVLFLLIAETIGLWAVNHYLVIAPARLAAANVAYQCAVASSVVKILGVTYTATFTAHERFGIFALVGILGAVLKLTIALLTLHSPGDHLIVYCILYASVSIITTCAYVVISKRLHPETRLMRQFHRPTLRHMLEYSGWTFSTFFSRTVQEQGGAFIVNRFFGTLINGAANIALQVMNVMFNFVTNITRAFSPQVVKEYAAANAPRVNHLVLRGTQIATLLYVLIVSPIFVNMDFLMSLWLVDVPQGAPNICRVLLIAIFLKGFNRLPYSVIGARGDVKAANLISSVGFLLTLPVSYLMVRITGSYLPVYALYALPVIINSVTFLGLLWRYRCGFNVRGFLLRAWLPIVATAIIAVVLEALAGRCLFTGSTASRWLILGVTCLISLACVVLAAALLRLRPRRLTA